MLDVLTVFDKSVLKKIPILIYASGSKLAVYNQLKNKIPGYQNNSLARRIALFTSNETREKHNIPVLLLILQIMISLYLGLVNAIKFFGRDILSSPVITLWVLILSVSLLFVWGFARYKLFAFTTAISLYSLSVAVNLALIIYKPDTQILVRLISQTFTLVFLTLLRKSIFPEITFWGNVKPDKKTDFKFSS